MTACRAGAVRDLRDLLAAIDPSVVVLVTGGASFAQSGAAAAIEPLLERCTVERISEVRPNPAVADVESAAGLVRRSVPDLVLAVGGGSVLDLGKAARGLHAEQDVRRAVSSGVVSGVTGPVLVAIPTTAGSGSEATHFCAVYVDGVKHSVGHPSFRPDHAVLDPDLTASMPPDLTAVTGLDALAQAMESMWSTQSTEESLALARRALELAWANLEEAVHTPGPKSRAAMCEAAHLAGRAIDISKTTAAHALSYSITIRHGVAHGHAVALTLGVLLEYNSAVTDADCRDPRGASFVGARIDDVLTTLGVADGAQGRNALADLVARLGLATTLAGVGVMGAAARRAIAASVDAQRLANNPRALGPKELTALVDGVR